MFAQVSARPHFMILETKKRQAHWISALAVFLCLIGFAKNDREAGGLSENLKAIGSRENSGFVFVKDLIGSGQDYDKSVQALQDQNKELVVMT
jgi:hypothetical protein